MYFLKLINKFIVSFTVLLLVGCADPNIPLSQGFWTDRPKPVVVVAMKKPLQADTSFSGAGLLDLAIITVVNHQFIDYVDQYELSGFDKLPEQLVQNLHQHEFKAKKYDGNIDLSQLKNSSESNDSAYERKDFTPLAAQLEANQLLLIHVNFVGSLRRYYGIIPMGPPSAYCKIEGRLINLQTNRILWRFTTAQEVKVTAPWSQPPSYPNFSNALNQAINQAKQAILSNFFSSAPAPAPVPAPVIQTKNK